MHRKILVVDDEPNIVTLLKMNLELNQYEVVSAYSGEEGLLKAREELPDLILLDLMLPDIDGITVCQRIRTDLATKHIPIIMLTAKTEEMDMIIGLEVGADDYISKPFSVRGVLARIKAVLRRMTPAVVSGVQGVHEFTVDDLIIDLDKHKLSINGEMIDVTYMEFKIIAYLAAHRDRVVNRMELVEALTEKDRKPDIKSVNVHVWNIRKKLQAHHPDEDYIETIRGVGYRMR